MLFPELGFSKDAEERFARPEPVSENTIAKYPIEGVLVSLLNASTSVVHRFKSQTT